jgi:hypothetical protein
VKAGYSNGQMADIISPEIKFMRTADHKLLDNILNKEISE